MSRSFFDGAAWGVLEVDSSSPRDFSQDTVEFLTAAAAVIGAAVQRHTYIGSDTAALAEAAAEAQRQEVLLRELQHRVKNNFQIILASIALQKRRLVNGEVHRALDHVASRINAISLAHDQLAPRQNAQAVDVAAYLRALCTSIEQQVDNVAIDVQADEIELSIDRAVPLGLILNEAATNSVKHAFGEDGGRITIRLQAGVGYGEARLTVTDNGHGLQSPRPGGSGLKLIASLARQMGAVSSRKAQNTACPFLSLSLSLASPRNQPAERRLHRRRERWGPLAAAVDASRVDRFTSRLQAVRARLMLLHPWLPHRHLKQQSNRYHGATVGTSTRRDATDVRAFPPSGSAGLKGTNRGGSLSPYRHGRSRKPPTRSR